MTNPRNKKQEGTPFNERKAGKRKLTNKEYNMREMLGRCDIPVFLDDSFLIKPDLINFVSSFNSIMIRQVILKITETKKRNTSRVICNDDLPTPPRKSHTPVLRAARSQPTWII